MDATIKRIELSIPEADLPLLRLLAKRLGWTIEKKKSGIEKGLEDIAAGRVHKAKNTEDLF